MTTLESESAAVGRTTQPRVLGMCFSHAVAPEARVRPDDKVVGGEGGGEWDDERLKLAVVLSMGVCEYGTSIRV